MKYNCFIYLFKISYFSSVLLKNWYIDSINVCDSLIEEFQKCIRKHLQQIVNMLLENDDGRIAINPDRFDKLIT